MSTKSGLLATKPNKTSNVTTATKPPVKVPIRLKSNKIIKLEGEEVLLKVKNQLINFKIKLNFRKSRKTKLITK